MRTEIRLRALCVCALFGLSVGAFSQATARWLSTAEEAKPYADIASRLVSFAENVRAAGIDEKLFLDRLMEGVRKRAPVARIEKAMEEESYRLVQVAGALDSSGLRMSSASRERAVVECSLSLRASVSREELDLALRRTVAKNASVERVGAILSVLAAADPARLIDSGHRLELIASIADSTIKTDRIDSFVSIFSRGRSFGLRADRIARIVVDALGTGGGLAAVDAALNRERNRR